METAKNVLDAWVETQSKTVNNMVDTTKKIQESFMSGNVLEKGTDIYKDWFQNQKSLIENAINTTTSNVAGVPTAEQVTKNASETYQEVMNMQMMFAKTWADMFKMNGSTAQSTQEGFLKETTRIYDKWNSLYSGWMQQATPQWSAFNFNPANLSGGGNFNQLFNSGGAYFKMFEVWQPLMQQWQKMQANGMQPDADWLKKTMDMNAYKEVFDKMFGFATPDKFKDFFGDLSHFTGSYQDTTKHWQDYWQSQMQHLNKSMAHPSSYNFGSAMQPFMSQVEKALAPLSRLLPEGKEKETMEDMKKLQETFGQFWTKHTEMQYLVYSAGYKSMEKLMAEQMKKATEQPAAMPNYGDFYNQWLNTTEAVMIDTFAGEEFGKAQGEMTKLAMDIKQNIEKQLERNLVQYPVVVRSEADEMAKTIHELRTRVRALEKALEQNAIVIPVATTDEEKNGKAKAKAKA